MTDTQKLYTLKDAERMRREAMDLLKIASDIDGLVPVPFVHNHECSGYGQTLYLSWMPKDADDELVESIIDAAIEMEGSTLEMHRGEYISMFGGELTIENLVGAQHAPAPDHKSPRP